MVSIRKRKTTHGHNYEVDYVDGSGVRRPTPFTTCQPVGRGIEG